MAAWVSVETGEEKPHEPETDLVMPGCKSEGTGPSGMVLLPRPAFQRNGFRNQGIQNFLAKLLQTHSLLCFKM